MSKRNAVAVLKDGTKLPITYISNTMGCNYDFDLDVNGEIIECMYIANTSNPERKWLERDLEAEKKNHCDGYYKKLRFDIDHIEMNTILN